uniref:1,4-dihydroxy-2-naphthoate octaprenyltransferase n=1 Tax=Heterosigma akashiwo TaxID=2829 RepID=A0A7S4DAV0_HETAK|mmetsp:Transcript_25486/g.40232  ORF Transcript_25486/g.40232 Transcript_25486/m.40232 type:complete len:304 (+) Transcript_25486:45-956(+)
MIMHPIAGGIIAARPWSWTAAVVPIILTGVLLKKESGISLLSYDFGAALAIGVLVQAAANLTNSYLDWKKGVDKKETAGDRAIVDGLITPVNAILVSIICYGISILLAFPYLVKHGASVKWIFAAGMLLSFFYTANPFSLKYLCLGDVAIFLAFGPLLMGFTSVLLAGDLRTSVLPYTLPVGLLTEAILHANNMRDIKSDTRAGIYTLASVVGFGPAKVLYAFMVFGAFLVALAMAVTHSLGCALVLPALPLGVRNIADLQPHSPKMKNMDERTAQLHLLYGALLIAGVAGSDRLAALLGTAH